MSLGEIIIEETLIEELIQALKIAENDPKESPGDYLQIAIWIEKNYGIKFGYK